MSYRAAPTVPSQTVQRCLGRAVDLLSRQTLGRDGVHMVGDRYEGGAHIEVVVDPGALRRARTVLPTSIDGFPVRVVAGARAVALGQAKFVPGQVSFAALPPGMESMPDYYPGIVEHGSYETGEPYILHYGLDRSRGIMGLGQYESLGDDDDVFDDDRDYVLFCDNWARRPDDDSNRVRGLVVALDRARLVLRRGGGLCRIYEADDDERRAYVPGAEAVAVAPEIGAPSGGAPPSEGAPSAGDGGGDGDGVVVSPSPAYRGRVTRWASSGAPAPGDWHSVAPPTRSPVRVGTIDGVTPGGGMLRPAGGATVTPARTSLGPAGGAARVTAGRTSLAPGGGSGTMTAEGEGPVPGSGGGARVTTARTSLGPADSGGGGHRLSTTGGRASDTSGRRLLSGSSGARLAVSGRPLGLRR